MRRTISARWGTAPTSRTATRSSISGADRPPPTAARRVLWRPRGAGGGQDAGGPITQALAGGDDGQRFHHGGGTADLHTRMVVRGPPRVEGSAATGAGPRGAHRAGLAPLVTARCRVLAGMTLSARP